MRKITLGLIGSGLLFVTSVSLAASTSLTSNWTCTTNASSSSVAADVSADKEMSEKSKSASDAFAFAAKNCRDCTKITCESGD